MIILIIIRGIFGFVGAVSAILFAATFPKGVREKYWILRKLRGKRIILFMLAIISIGGSYLSNTLISINSGETTQKIIELLEKELQQKNEQIASLHGMLRHYQTQEPSEKARQLAQQIPDDAGHYALALKAITQKRFSDADDLLNEATKQKEVELAKIYVAQGNSKYYQGKYGEALHWSKKASSLLPDHPSILNDVGIYSIYAGEYKEAEPLLKRALKIREKQLNPYHPDLAIYLNNLAGFYNSQAKYDQAEPLYKRAIEIGEKTLGLEHPTLAVYLNNLAGLYIFQAKYEQTELHYKQALEILKKALGEEHPNVATVYNNLAELYRSQGKYEQAEPLYLQAIEIDEKAFGKEHPRLATDLNNLALLYYAKGKYEQAKSFYKRVIGD